MGAKLYLTISKLTVFSKVKNYEGNLFYPVGQWNIYGISPKAFIYIVIFFLRTLIHLFYFYWYDGKIAT